MSQAVYDQIGEGYVSRRRPDPRIAAAILDAIGDARRVINVGAGTGSYEPNDREVLAVEPSETMIAQRPAGSAPCLQGTAEALPAETGSFDCAMAILTLHHWTDWRKGLDEMRRVASRAVILTFDPDQLDRFWLVRDYFPEFVAFDRARVPSLDAITEHFGGGTVRPVPIPHDCVDGFQGAYWRRPELYLDENVRRSISTFQLVADPMPGLDRLASDLESGRWRERNAEILERESIDLGYRLIRCG